MEEDLGKEGREREVGKGGKREEEENGKGGK